MHVAAHGRAPRAAAPIAPQRSRPASAVRDARVRRRAAQRREARPAARRRSRGPGSRAARRRRARTACAISPASSGPERDAEVAARPRTPTSRSSAARPRARPRTCSPPDGTPATPMLRDRARRASATANVCAKASAPMPRPATAGPGDEQPLAAARVEEVTEDRLHDRGGDRRGEHDRRRARVREVQLAAQERQQRGHAALREVGDHVAAREQPERAERPAQTRRGDGGGGHASTVSWAAMPMPPPGVYVPLLTLYDAAEDIDVDATAAFGLLPRRGRRPRPRAGGVDGRVPPAHARRAPDAARGRDRGLPGHARARPRSARPRSATPWRSPSTPPRAARPP